MLIKSSIRDFDSKGMSLSGKASAPRPRKGGRHAVSKFRRAVRVKIIIEDWEREAAWWQNLRGRRLSVREGELMRYRALDSTLFKTAVCMEPPYTWCVLHTRADKVPVYGHQLCGSEKLAESIQNAQLRGSWFSSGVPTGIFLDNVSATTLDFPGKYLNSGLNICTCRYHRVSWPDKFLPSKISFIGTWSVYTVTL